MYWRRLLTKFQWRWIWARGGLIHRRLLFWKIYDGLPFYLKLKMSKLEFFGGNGDMLKPMFARCVAFNFILDLWWIWDVICCHCHWIYFESHNWHGSPFHFFHFCFFVLNNSIHLIGFICVYDVKFSVQPNSEWKM